MSTEGLAKIARVSGSESKVLCAMMLEFKFENYLIITSKQIALVTSLHRNTVSKAISGLVRQKIVKRRGRAFMFNPYLGWMGATERKSQGIAIWMKLN